MTLKELIKCLRNFEFKVGNIELSDFYKKNKDKKIKLGIYARLSKRNDRAIEKQISIVKRYAITNLVLDEENIKIYSDNGFSGTSRTRPGYLKMLRDIRLEQINVIMTTHLDRLGRESNQVVEKLYPNSGVEYIYISIDNKFINALDNLDIIKSESEVSDSYAARCSIKSRAGIKESMRNGSVINAAAPYGYKIKYDAVQRKRKFVLDEEIKVKTVKEIFNLYLISKSMSEIAEILNEKGILTPSAKKEWTKSTIEFILKNSLYTGELFQGRYQKLSYVNNGEGARIKRTEKESWINGGKFEAIIDKKNFENVQNMIKENRSIKRGSEKKHTFTGILTCGDCRKALVYKKRAKGYKCSTNDKKASVCTTHLIKEDELVKLIMPKILEKVMENYDEISKYIKKRLEKETSIESSERKIKEIDKEKRKNIQALIEACKEEKYLDMIKKEVDCEIEKLDRERAIIESEIKNEEKIKDRMIDVLNDISKFIKVENYILKLFIKKILIYQNGTIKIDWRC